jgi:hypothetical protein
MVTHSPENSWKVRPIIPVTSQWFHYNSSRCMDKWMDDTANTYTNMYIICVYIYIRACVCVCSLNWWLLWRYSRWMLGVTSGVIVSISSRAGWFAHWVSHDQRLFITNMLVLFEGIRFCFWAFIADPEWQSCFLGWNHTYPTGNCCSLKSS